MDIKDKHVKDVSVVGNHTIINFTDNTSVQLSGQPMELPDNLNIQRCVFCGKPSDVNSPLYTSDEEHYICMDCVKLAYQTYIKNGFDMESDKKDEHK